MSKVLYSSGAVRRAIKALFERPSRRDRRVAIVAYVGKGAEAYLPDPKGLHLVCCPQPGATSADGVNGLLRLEARVQFADKMHMKVYWSKHRGAVVTSANLSSSALGIGSQKEAGVLLPPGAVDIDKLLAYAEPRRVSQPEMDRLYIGARQARGGPRGPKPGGRRERSFKNWYGLPYREPWKMGWYGDYGYDFSEAAKDKSWAEYGKREPECFMNVGKDQVSVDEWLLCFCTLWPDVRYIEWMYVDFVVKASPRDDSYDKEYPYQAVQVHTLRRYRRPPFRLDPKFKTAFKKAAKKFGIEKIERLHSLVPPKVLADRIARAMRIG